VLTYVLLGATYAFAAAVQPGPYQAYLVAQALSHGWRRVLPAALAPVMSDIPVIVVVVLLLSRLAAPLLDGLRIAGGLFLLYLAWHAWRAWRAPPTPALAAASAPHRTFATAVVINLLNPNPWLGWSLVLGPLLLSGWRASRTDAAAMLGGFYATLVASNAGIVMLSAEAGRLGPRVARALVGVSGAALTAFGVWQLWTGTGGLLR